MTVNATPALVVDLDGTLVVTDSLHESVFRGLRRHAARTLSVLFQFFGHRDRARLKEALLGAAGLPSVASLPYRASVLALVETARREGRPVVLATGAHQRLADAVAAHLGTFDLVCGTERENLTRHRKHERLTRLLDGRPYTYVGDSADDLHVWPHANEAIAVAPASRVLSRLRKLVPGATVLDPRRGVPLKTLLSQMRVHQWSKCTLVFVPVIAGHHIFEGQIALAAGWAALAFAFMSSTIYVLNDLFDIEADRQHPSKRHRPLAAGLISIPQALALSGASFAASIGIGSLVGGDVVLALLCYGLLSFAYTLRLKRVLVLDVVVLASLYCMRVVVGGLAADIVLSPWLLAFMIFEFFGLALVKRSVELARMTEPVPGRGYRPDDRPTVRILGASSTMLGVLVMSLYLQDTGVPALYPRAQLLWAIIPLLIYWSGRLWILEDRGVIDDDPLQFVVRDRVSIMAAGATLLILLGASQRTF